jgi:hypothetical protein
MSGQRSDENMRFRAGAEITWAVYVALLAVLTAAEALIRPEVGFDKLLDVAILVIALAGAAMAWIVSAYLVLRSADGTKPASATLRIAAGWFFGPLLGCGAVLAINSLLGGDIDGGLLLFYPPLLAIILPITVLPAILFVWRRRLVRRD